MCNNEQHFSLKNNHPVAVFAGAPEVIQDADSPEVPSDNHSFLQQRPKMYSSQHNLNPLTEVGRYSRPVDHSNAQSPAFVESETIEFGEPGPRSNLHDRDPVTLDTNIKQNKRAHHTSGFTEDALIVRRGQEFDIDITFNKDMDDLESSIFVKLEMGLNANEFRGTKIILSSTLGWESDWSMWVKPFSGKTVPVGITSPPNCLVGKFKLTIGLRSGYNHVKWNFSTINYIYILFNPWLKEDTVYMSSEDERKEYVLNQAGQIYNGTAENPSAIPWNFGQFQEGILTTCLEMLDDSKISTNNRGKAIVVVRMGSALINSQDDNGVVVGNWSGKYKGGTPPLSWIGSPDILLQYHKKKHPVRYGQCWVYAGVFNTFLRCLGIPARVITNYRSAHDNDGNLKIDIILTRNLQFNSSKTNDSLWNYHCWNECYIERNDLPVGLGGWQVVDATPQETSDGLYRCGPASVEAIKHGLICYPFDSRFVFAEVNSDIVFHVPGANGRLETIYVDTASVGWKVLTKQIGRRAPADITNTYKFIEGTVESDMTVKNAEQYGSKRSGPYAPLTDIKMRVEVSPARLHEGFEVTLHLTNESRYTYIVDIYISGNVVYYTGVHSAQFMFQNLEGTVPAYKTEKVTVQVQPHEYKKKLVDQAMLQFIIVGNVRETKRALIATKLVKLEGPKLTIRVTKNQYVGQMMTIQVEFTNNLNEPLEDAYLHLEISGAWAFLPKIYSEIAPYATVTRVETYTPKTAMETSVFASLYASPLQSVYAEEDILVWE
ncbi:hypothetical protein AAFF_G00002230 [Aldrovandia affinis]|uniref:protein-glutamine gamma-glutamyltransferase n=1 Tax=Aldrovandia affinis TaxID=143900 RepID=A0AAD7X4Q2_9TELE|nr:hypothetical protein AAFF_G00002230 [Aldrovandia affinis]